MLAIDLCAGSGWAVACAALGISELGIEIMAEAIATRNAMGTYTQDISIAGLPDNFCSQAPIQIAGPPCQTFSMAGNGEGRQALEEVLRRIQVFADTGILERGGSGDPRTWLVLEPLRLAIGGMPTYIVWEQVPPVLPVWEACANVLRAAGYSAWTGILNSEQYGVPQTRRRAFLIARKDGVPAAPPVPTHSRYYSRDPGRLDAGVLPWVSMAEALGWGTTGRPGFTVTGGGAATGGAEPFGTRARESLLAYRNGTHDHAAERSETAPAPTVMFGARSNGVTWVQRSNYTGRGERTTPSPVPGSPPLGMRQLSEPSSTVTAKSSKWAQVRPATPVQGDPRIATPEHRDRAGGEPQFDSASIRVSVQEAAILQTFPPGHPFQGTKGKQYLQIGNAVPPLLGKAILSTFLTETT